MGQLGSHVVYSDRQDRTLHNEVSGSVWQDDAMFAHMGRSGGPIAEHGPSL